MEIRRWGASFALLAILGWGCDAEGEFAQKAATSRPAPTPTARPTGTAVAGGVSTGDGATSPTPTPTASAVSLVPRVARVEISTSAASVSLNAFDNGTPKDVPGSVRLLATVVYADGVRNDLVTWSSLAPGLVTVSEQGEVKPAATMGPPATGSTSVVAASQFDPTVTATCTITVIP